MKRMKMACAAAMLSPLAAAPVFAQSSVTLSGRVDMGVVSINNGDGRVTRVDSGTYTASRLGIGGTEDLGDGLSAGFYLEDRFAADTGTPLSGARFFNAGSQVFLSDARLGTLTLGRQYTPLFWGFLLADDTGPLRMHGWSATNTIQRSATRIATAASPIQAAGALDSVSNGVYQLGISSTFEDNMVVYKSPTFANTIVRLGAGSAEGYAGSSARVLSAGTEYKGDRLAAGLVYQEKRALAPVGTGGYQTQSDTLLSGMYDVVPQTVKLWGNYHLWKLDDPGARLKGRDWMLGASYWAGSSQLWVNYAKKTFDDCASCGAAGLSVGYHYRLSKRTELYTAASHVRNQANSANGLNGILPGTPGKNLTAYTIGLATTF
ncbi:porin [Paracidovorax avenae]